MKYYERKYFSIEEKRIFLNKTDCKCAHCGKTLNEETMTIDHIFPISKGGDNNGRAEIYYITRINRTDKRFTF